MQDFYNHYKNIFDLKLNSFFNFIDNYIDAGNYEKKYVSFENISDYFNKNERVFTEDKNKPDKYKYRVSSKDFINIFEWNNDTIIVDLRIVVEDLIKSKIDNIYLSKFISFMYEDLNNEYKIFNSEDFEFIDVCKIYGIENSESVNFLDNSLRTFKSNKELIENLLIKFSEINKTDYLKFLNENENHADAEKKHISNKRNNNSSKIPWNDTEESLIRLFECLYNSGLINMESYKNRFSIITKTFLNKAGCEFKNKQLGVTAQKMKSDKITKDSNSYVKFEKLIADLSKYIRE